jgi:hypothetical protein
VRLLSIQKGEKNAIVSLHLFDVTTKVAKTVDLGKIQ